MMLFQFALLSLLLSLAAGDPEPQFNRRPFNRPRPYSYRPYDHYARTIRDFRQSGGNGVFNYGFQTDNGINVAASGRPGVWGQSNIAGSYSHPHPEGGVSRVTYVADEFGYRPQSPSIPTPHPLPAHSLQQIRKAEWERNRGIRWY